MQTLILAIGLKVTSHLQCQTNQTVARPFQKSNQHIPFSAATKDPMTNDRHLYHWKESTGKPLIRKSLPINSILPTCSIQAGYGQIKGSHHSSIACCQIVPRRQTKQLWSIKGNHQQLLYLYMENPISMLIYIYIKLSPFHPVGYRSCHVM